ncbi:MAG: nicotinate-nucleotide--dimethylbenzimidazole phosphoribosyltransferase [Kineosporiaceae bacterium]|nr:nicotinate-nucleotide--dimethylbenzimidazole phosphoribosyltransferase [Kineosporiaceae bacterium]
MGELPQDLRRVVEAIRPADPAALSAGRERQRSLTKPPGSLGVLEDVSVQLCGLAGSCPPPLPVPAAIAVFAGDHGVHAQGVTPWPQQVTALMVANFAAGGAAICVLADQAGAELVVVDIGVAGDLPAGPRADPTTDLPTGSPVVLNRRVRAGTADLSVEPAMSRAEAQQALRVGVEVADHLIDRGARCLLTGDMGIANTTASAALIAAFAGAEPAAVTGRGTGVDEATHAHKIEVVRAGLALHREVVGRVGRDPVGVLAALGGLEHAGLAGFVLAAAARRVPVILDGVIAGAAALVAQALAPEVVAACIAGHRSAEPGHLAALTQLGLRPLVDLDLRLGEGSGAVLALPLVVSAARILRDMATFADAGIQQ